jgi:hypothetical protein
VAADVEAERRQVHQQWTYRLERAQYAVERAARQYNTVEPENRLVARTLERQWEEALAEAEHLQADYARFLAVQPTTLASAERDAIRRLASDVPALWRAPGTPDAERQAIIRQVVDHVVVMVHGESEPVTVQGHWVGGHRTEATQIRPVACLEQLSYYPQLLARAAALYAQGADRRTIAQTLNRAGWRPAKRTTTFSALMVGRLLARQGLRYVLPVQAAVLAREAHAWTLQELEQLLGIPEETLICLAVPRAPDGTPSNHRVPPAVVDLGRRRGTRPAADRTHHATDLEAPRAATDPRGRILRRLHGW